MPPLVERYAVRPSTISSTWPPAPSTPGQWGSSPSVPTGWGGVDGSPWGHPNGVLTPMFPPPVTIGPPTTGWPGGFAGVQSPAVTALPMTAIATGTNDNWMDMQHSGWDGEDEGSSTGFPTLTRGLSRHDSRSSHRSQTQFSGDSSPSSQSSDISRSRSYTGSVSIHDKRPPREWRSDFTMGRSATLGAAIGNLLNLNAKRSRSSSRRGKLPSLF